MSLIAAPVAASYSSNDKLRDIGAKTIFTNYIEADVIIEEIENGL